MIPQEKSAAVFRGVHVAFGATAIEDLRRMTKGLSSDLAFRIVVHGSPYLLRIMTGIDERMDPGRIFVCMSAAAEAGLAPCVRYSNAEDGISITDFVEAVPFPATQALVQLPFTLRRLHALPAFPKAFYYVTAHNGFVWKFRKTGLLPKGGRRGIQVCLQFPGDDQVLLESPRPPDNFCPGPSRSGAAGPTDYLRISNDDFYMEDGLLSCYKKSAG